MSVLDQTAGNNDSGGGASERPVVLLCECAGTMTNIDFDSLEQRALESADVDRKSTRLNSSHT